MSIQVGDQVPLSSSFRSRSFPEFAEHWAVVYFFPQGNNPHCVMESRRFQSLLAEFGRLNVKLIGVSVDPEEEQKYFRSMCALEFPVVSDADHEISLAYGVLETQQHEGRQVTYARRETFLIGPQGRVEHHWTEVDPNVHASEVLAQVQRILDRSA